MIAFPTHPGGYSLVYVDPPWSYRDKANAGKRGASHKYACISLEELKRLPIDDIAAKDCALFMWATPPMFPEALALGAAWGFRYKTIAFWWAKHNTKRRTPFFGMGNWTRANGEPCLLFIRGKIKRIDAGVSSFVWAMRQRHSEKPACVRDRIVELMGDIPRIELFSRHVIPGWSRWGNEVLA